MPIFQPTHEELLEMGFHPSSSDDQEITHYWHDSTLSYHLVSWNERQKAPFWTFSSWYRTIGPQSKDDVLAINRMMEGMD